MSRRWPTAIEGRIKKHYYPGEVVGEERVYDNRLLMSLIGLNFMELSPNRRKAAQPTPRAAREMDSQSVEACRRGSTSRPVRRRGSAARPLS